MKESQEAEVLQVLAEHDGPVEALRALSPGLFTAYQRYVREEYGDPAEVEAALLEWPLGWWRDTQRRFRQCRFCSEEKGAECEGDDRVLNVRPGMQPRWRRTSEGPRVDEIECSKWQEATIRKRLRDSGVPLAFCGAKLEPGDPLLEAVDSLLRRENLMLLIEGEPRRIGAGGAARYIAQKAEFHQFRYLLVDGLMSRQIRDSWRGDEPGPLIPFYHHPLIFIDSFEQNTQQSILDDVRALVESRQKNRRATIIVCDDADRTGIEGVKVRVETS